METFPETLMAALILQEEKFLFDLSNKKIISRQKKDQCFKFNVDSSTLINELKKKI